MIKIKLPKFNAFKVRMGPPSEKGTIDATKVRVERVLRFGWPRRYVQISLVVDRLKRQA